MIRRVRHLVAGLPLALLAAVPAATVAHEFWVEPSRLALHPHERVTLSLCVGDGEDVSALARDESRIETFTSIGPAGRQAIPGRHGSDPAGVARFGESGDYVIAYETNHAYTTQPSVQFEEYLFEVGLGSIAAVRHKRGDGARRVREAYSRHAKALVRVGDDPAVTRDRAVGLRLELILEDPTPASAADETTIRLRYLGRPLAGALVTATALGSPERVLQARTDTAGRVRLTLRDADTWRISAVHMVRGSRDLGADWESLWASLVFAGPGAAIERQDAERRCEAPSGRRTTNMSRLSQETAPPPHRVAERGFGHRILGARIDQRGKFLRVLDEIGQQAPAHQPEAPPALAVERDDGDRLRRRDVPARGEVRRVGIAEKAAHFLRRERKTIARAHAVTLWQS